MTSAAGLKILTQSTTPDPGTAWADEDEFAALRWSDIGAVDEAISGYLQGSFAVPTAFDYKPMTMAQIVETTGLLKKYRSIYEDLMAPSILMNSLAATPFAISDFKLPDPVTFVREKTGATAKQRVLRLATPHHAPDLLASFEQYATANWDADGAEPITSATLAYARHILRLLPTTFGEPDVAPAADGSIALEWVPEGHPKLDRLFLDIGPGEVWRAYWMLCDGTYGRLPGQGYSADIRPTLRKLFDDINT